MQSGQGINYASQKTCFLHLRIAGDQPAAIEPHRSDGFAAYKKTGCGITAAGLTLKFYPFKS
jgi:hypothetical protein